MSADYLEVQIENWVVDKAYNTLGVPSLKLNVTGNTGWPDREFWIPGGRPLLIEFKRPGEVASPKQALIHKLLKYRGYNVQIHENREEALQAILTALDAGRLGL